MDSNRPITERAELAPAILLLGDVVVRALTLVEHVDFILSVRDEKLATLLQLFRDSGWWIIAVISGLWLLYEWDRQRRNKEAKVVRSVGALVFSTALVSFLFGMIIAVSATASLPTIVQVYSGDPVNKTCNAQVDTSRLLGFQDNYELVLICGASDPTIDPQEDTRIAVSSGFHINGGPMGIVTPLGLMNDVWKEGMMAHLGENFQFSMWHTIVAIPKDIDPTTIKRVSDVEKIGGRILTEPIGGYGSSMVITNPTPAPKASKSKSSNT